MRMVCRGRQKRVLQPHHHDAVAAMLEHGFHVGGTDRGRLLQPDVEAGVQRLAGKLGMLPWGHAQEHGIELLVAIHLGSVAVAALYAVLVGGAPSQLQVPIAERREPHRQVVQRGQNNSSGYSSRGLYKVVAGNVPDAAGMIHQFPPPRASGAAAPTGRSSRTDRRADLRRWLGPGGAGRSRAGRRPGAPRRLRHPPTAPPSTAPRWSPRWRPRRSSSPTSSACSTRR